MKGYFVKFYSWVSLLIGVLSGCADRPPITREEASIHQKAVYFNPQRPAADRRRDAERKPAEILSFANVQAGDKVIDLLGGGGWYTELLSNVVGEDGHVYLVNTPLFLNFSSKELEGRLRKQRLKNVTRVDVPWNDLNLPTDVDVIWLALSYHDIYIKRPPEKKHFEAHRTHFFEQLRNALKPGGLLFVSDHAATPDSRLEDIRYHRIDEAFAVNDIQNEGFTLLKKSTLLRNPQDIYTTDIWDKRVARNTDRFVHLYQKSPVQDTLSK